MALSEAVRQVVIEEARRKGVDENKLLEAAERAAQSRPPAASSAPKPEEKPAEKKSDAKPVETTKPLYAYHLPFVTVNEVRTVWLGLAAIAGGEMNAAKWAAEQAGAPPTPQAAGDGEST